jgi:hypothetical protein
MTAPHGEPIVLGERRGLDLAAEVVVIDGTLDPATCRALIEGADVDRWLSCTAEISRAANGPHTLPPRRIADTERPCRRLGDQERPRFAVIEDPVLALRLFYRLAKALPPTREQAELAGIKPLLRCLRYQRGEGTTIHCDPARETSDGQRSQLSVMVFLNDDFAGGAIEFPNVGRVIEPRVGRAIVFPHAALHRDHMVGRGRKFVLEAEVFYSPHWQPYAR